MADVTRRGFFGLLAALPFAAWRRPMVRAFPFTYFLNARTVPVDLSRQFSVPMDWTKVVPPRSLKRGDTFTITTEYVVNPRVSIDG